jgi:hypothetical protein
VTPEQFLTSSYGNTLKRFLHYRDNTAEIDRKAKNCDRLWGNCTIFDTLNDAYKNYFNPSEHLAADKIILKIRGRVVM